MTVRVLTARELKPVPWKNGGGFTREIAAHPPGAGMDGFDWRVSTAEVATDGPFSKFEGVERTLVVLAGAGFHLAVEGREPVKLTPASEPLVFPADVATTASLLAGPVSDLNVMVRRGAWRAQVSRRSVAQATRLVCATPAGLLVLEGPLSLGGVVALEAGDVVRMDQGDVAILHPHGGTSSLIVVELSPAASAAPS